MFGPIMSDLSGKVALVTGAGSGFGAGIARRFCELGATVIGGDINQAGLNKTCAEIGSGMSGSVLDVGDGESFRSVAESLRNEHGHLDILVNNAGYTHRNQSMFDVGEEDFDKLMQVNVKALYLATIHVIPLMLEKGGSVINIVSTAAIRPRKGITWYNGSKGAALTLTKSMASELADSNVRVNAINPVMGETGMLDALIGGDSEQKRAAVTSNIPLGRLSTPGDIAAAAAFLASDEAGFITGTALEVDGGRCI